MINKTNTNVYNFDDVESEGPEIVLGGYKYNLRYPTLEEVERIQNLKDDTERAEVIFTFVVPSEPNIPSFRDVLKTKSIKVTVAFTDMVKKEFGVEE